MMVCFGPRNNVIMVYIALFIQRPTFQSGIVLVSLEQSCADLLNTVQSCLAHVQSCLVKNDTKNYILKIFFSTVHCDVLHMGEVLLEHLP